MKSKSRNDLLGLQRISLVGRRAYLDEIFKRTRQAFKGQRLIVIPVIGEGGTGKTAVLQEILRELKEDEKAICPDPEGLVDLYHLENRTMYGLAEAIVKSLDSRFPRHFTEFHRLMRDLYQALSDHQNEKAKETWNKAENALLRDLTTVSQGKQIWIVLDTAENLHFPQDALEEQGEGESFIIHARNWLRSFIERALKGNIVLLLAGRRSEGDQKDFLDVLPERCKTPSVVLDPLNEEQCAKYLLGVADNIKSMDPKGAANIRKYLDAYPSRILRLHTQGKPLYLAMVSDILRVGGSLPREYYTESSNANGDPKTLANQFMNLRSPIGETLQALSVLRKGADAGLLSKVMGNIPKKDAESYLEQIHDLTLVKRRPSAPETPRQYFLHDEVYYLYTQSFEWDDSVREVLYKQINEYYQEEFEDLWRKSREQPYLKSLYQKRLHISQTEKIHYALWFYPWRGYAEYFKESCSAIAQRLDDFYPLLENEFEQTQRDLNAIRRFPDGLKQYLEWDGKIRKVDILSTNRQADKARDALTMLKIDDRTPDLLRAYYCLQQAVLVLRGLQTTGTLGNVEVFLQDAETNLGRVKEKDLVPACDVLQGFIDNYRGFYYRKNGWYHRAHEHYRKAAARLRRQQFTGLSGVLVNQAYAMSLLGLDYNARETAREAFEIAERFGSPHDPIRALNVRSIVESFAGEPGVGREFAEKALKRLEDYPNKQILYLVYISFSRALRYLWNQAFADGVSDYFTEGKKLISEGLALLEGKLETTEVLGSDNTGGKQLERGAISLLKDYGDPENLAVAYNESGSLWRDMRWLIYKQSKLGNSLKKNKDLLNRLDDITESRLRFAAGVESIRIQQWEAEIKQHINLIGGSPYIPSLALVNLGWHYFYRKEKDDIDTALEICRIVDAIIPPGYHWQGENPPDSKLQNADVMLWAVLGKMEMLRGYEKLYQWREKEKKDPALFDNIARHITLSLEYNYLIGKASFNSRRALSGLEKRIRESDNWESGLLPRLYKSAKNASINLSVDDKKPRLFKWMEERFGPYDLIVGDSK